MARTKAKKAKADETRLAVVLPSSIVRAMKHRCSREGRDLARDRLARAPGGRLQDSGAGDSRSAGGREQAERPVAEAPAPHRVAGAPVAPNRARTGPHTADSACVLSRAPLFKQAAGAMMQRCVLPSRRECRIFVSNGRRNSDARPSRRWRVARSSLESRRSPWLRVQYSRGLPG
jgi:hypothetical protein